MAGLAGVGKTALAIDIAHMAVDQNWYPGGVVFLDLMGYAEPGQRMSGTQAVGHVLSVLGVPAAQVPGGHAERSELYRALLVDRARNGLATLVIADNASSADQVQPLVPVVDTHRMLITSRQTLADLDGAQLLDLDTLEPHDSVLLVAEALRVARGDDPRIDADPASVARLAQLCGHLPLALRITGALLAADPDLSVAELAHILSDAEQRLRSLAYGDNLAVRTAFDLTYRQMNGEHARVFRLMSVNPTPVISAEAAAAVVGLPVLETRRILVGLRGSNLLQSAGPAGRWRMHDLVYLHARERARDEVSEQLRHAAVHRLVVFYVTHCRAAADHIDRKVLPDARSPIFPTREQAVAWLSTERPNLVAMITLAHTHQYHAECCALMEALFYDLVSDRELTEAANLLQIALSAARHTGDRRAEARLLRCLGLILSLRLQRTESVETLTNALRIARELGERVLEGEVLDELGGTYRDLRKLPDAIRSLEQAVRIGEETGDDIGRATALNNLADVLRQVRRTDEAIRAHENALETYESVGIDDGRARSLAGLGWAHQAHGDFQKAVTCYQSALEIFLRIRDREREGQTLRWLGIAYLSLGRTADSIDFFHRALRICDELHMLHRRGQVLGDLGDALVSEGRVTEARATLEESLLVARELADRFCEARALLRLGATDMEVGDLSDARRSLEQALTIFTGLADRHWAAETLERLGLLAEHESRPRDAISHYRSALQLCRDLSDQANGQRIQKLIDDVTTGNTPHRAGSEAGQSATTTVRSVVLPE